MAQVLVTDTNLSNIATAIRGKNGFSTLYTPAEMSTAITALKCWVKIGDITVTTSTTSTSASALSTTYTNSALWNKDVIVYVRVRDKAGKRAGYFYGSDTIFMNYQDANGSTSSLSYAGRLIHRYSTSSQWSTYIPSTNTGYGVYPYSINSSGKVTIYQRYSSSYSLTINGTYKIEFYTMAFPDGKSPYDGAVIL